MSVTSVFLAGANTLGYFVAALLFMKARNRTGDILFTHFSIAFALLGISQFLGVVSGLPSDQQSWVFLVRLAAFVLIILAIAAKNFRTNSNEQS